MKIGKRGEVIAARYLASNGFTILAQNYRALSAEIDLICEEQPATGQHVGELVFVEVKTRRTSTYGTPLEAITPAKLALVKRAADHYLFTHNLEDRICRFDAIGITMGNGQPQIEHVRDIIDY